MDQLNQCGEGQTCGGLQTGCGAPMDGWDIHLDGNMWAPPYDCGMDWQVGTCCYENESACSGDGGGGEGPGDSDCDETYGCTGNGSYEYNCNEFNGSSTCSPSGCSWHNGINRGGGRLQRGGDITSQTRFNTGGLTDNGCPPGYHISADGSCQCIGS